MAKQWVNTVPQGIAGTGNAVIYGDNPVAAQYGNQLTQFNNRRRQEELIRQKEAENLAASFRDNMLKASQGRLWAEDLGKIEQDHINKGIQLMQQGINPYESLDPRALDYQRERRRVEAMQGYRGATEKSYNDLIKTIGTTPDKYDPKDIKAINDFFNTTSISDAYSQNLGLPQLRERFNVTDALKDVKAVTQQDVDVSGNVRTDRKTINRVATEDAILGTLANNPRAEEFFQNVTMGIPVNEIRSFPKTYEENKSVIEKEVKDNKPFREELARRGIAPGSDLYKRFVDELAKTRTQAKNNFDKQLDELVAVSARGVSLFDKETPDYAAANNALAQQRLDLAERNYNRLLNQDSGGDSNPTASSFPVTTKTFRKPGALSPSGVRSEGEPVAYFDKFVATNPVSFGTSQLKSAYNVRKGKNVAMPASGSVELTGIGYTTVKGGKKQLKASLVTPDGEEFLVNIEDLPVKTRNDKYYKAARQAIGSAPVTAKPKQTTTKTTTFKGIPKGGF